MIPGSSVSLVMPDKVLVGLAASSGVNAAVGTATYAHVAVSKPTNTPLVSLPTAFCPSGWSCGDVGNPALVGNQRINKGTMTLQGGGIDIWGTSDQFHFVWRSLANNSTVSTRITALQQTNELAKAGVMLRTNLDDRGFHHAS